MIIGIFTFLCSEVVHDSTMVQVKCHIDLNWFDYEERDAYGRRMFARHFMTTTGHFS